MALISCPDCGTQFSDASPNCPNCGRPNTAQPQPAAGAGDPLFGGTSGAGSTGGTGDTFAGTGGAHGTGTTGGATGGTTGGTYGAGAPGGAGTNIPNYLVPSILVTLCCCLPVGVVAIIFAAQVNSKRDQGDIAGAMESSRKAKLWMFIGLGLGVLSWIGAIALNGLAFMAALAGA